MIFKYCKIIANQRILLNLKVKLRKYLIKGINLC